MKQKPKSFQLWDKLSQSIKRQNVPIHEENARVAQGYWKSISPPGIITQT